MTNKRPPIIEPCPWKRLCHCDHLDPCEAGQIAGLALAPGYGPAYSICPTCDQARHAVAAAKGKPVETRLRHDPWQAQASGVPTEPSRGYPGG